MIGGMMRKRLVLLIIFSVLLIAVPACGQKDEVVEEDVERVSVEEPVYINWWCEDANVDSGKAIAFFYEWLTDTREQNDEYFAVSEHYLSVDGKPLKVVDQGYGDIMELEDGSFKQMYWMNIGVLEPGVYAVESVVDITEKVYDGWDWYGPESDYESFHNICTITVGSEPSAIDSSEEQESPPAVDVPEIPTPTTETLCTIDVKQKTDWETVVCDTFDGPDTVLWMGSNQGTSAYIENGEYILDNSTKVTSGYKTGYIFPISAGSAPDHLISVDGFMDSKFRSCTWGVYVRSNPGETVYFFMIDNEGSFSLTGSTDQEANRYLGNIKTGRHNSIIWDGVNTITAVVEGKNWEFL